MRSPFRSFASFTTSAALSFGVIVTILLGYNFLSTEYTKYGKLEREQFALRNVKSELESIRDKVAKDLSSRIPQPGTPASMLAERVKALEAEVSDRQVARQKLWDDHPVERYLPTSNTFRRIATLDIEISFLQQALAYVRNLHVVTAGPTEAERQINWFQTGNAKLAELIYQNKKAQWELSKKKPLMWQVPYSDAYRQMKRLEEKERELLRSKNKHDDEIAHQRHILEEFRKRPRPGPLALDPASANRIIQSVNARLTENDKQLEGSNLHKFMRPVKEVMPIAFWILTLVLLSPLLVKAIAYYVIAPFAMRRPPICLLPDPSGQISSSLYSESCKSGQTTPSRVSLPLALAEGTELIILPSYLQGMSLHSESDTQWLLDWSMPLTSLAAGMYRLTRIRPKSEERITVSSSTDPLAEFLLIDVQEGSGLVLQPSSLVGIIQTRGEQLKITRHWRLGYLSAWLTLQFRYIAFHGPAKLIVKGCRGVRMEPAMEGRTVNQASTLGFSANLEYSVARNETFWSYCFGERELFNDSWRGTGCCVYAETPHPYDRSSLFGRGIQGIVDTILKIFGI